MVSSIAELVWERKPDLSSDGLEPLLMRVFGTRPDSIERVATGVSAVVFRVGHQGTAFYVRLAEEEGEDLAMDAAVMKELRERGVKVAEVIHVEAFVPSVRRSVMITAEVPGRPVSEVGPDDLKTVVREAGRDLAILNQSPISGFGWVRRDCSRWPPVGELAEYGGFVTSGLPDSWPGPFANLFDAPTIDLLGALVAEEAIRELHEPTFAHGDFDLTHIFCLNGTYTGLIDFGDMLGAEPTFDLGTFLWANPRSTDDGLFDALVDGYRSGAPVPGSIEDITRSAILHGLRLLARWTGPGYKLQRPAQPTAQRVARLLERL